MQAAKTDTPFRVLRETVDRIDGETDASFAHRIDQVGARLRLQASADYDRPVVRVRASFDVARGQAVVECRLFRPLM